MCEQESYGWFHVSWCCLVIPVERVEYSHSMHTGILTHTLWAGKYCRLSQHVFIFSVVHVYLLICGCFGCGCMFNFMLALVQCLHRLSLIKQSSVVGVIWLCVVCVRDRDILYCISALLTYVHSKQGFCGKTSMDVCLINGNCERQFTEKERKYNELPLRAGQMDLKGDSSICQPGCYSYVFVCHEII